MRAGRSLLLFMLVAILGGGALIGLDRLGDRRAYEAAERHLLDSERIRLIFGEEAVAERTGGSVMAGKVLNWNGNIRGAGYIAKARVGMNRQSTDESWRTTRAGFQLPGSDWVDAYAPSAVSEPAPRSTEPSIVEQRAWRFLSTGTAAPAPSPGNPVPVLHHPLPGHVRSLVRAGSAELAFTFADSAGRVIGDDLLRTWAIAVAFEETGQPLRGAELMRDWIDTHPPNSQAWSGIARLYQDATWYPHAVEATSRAIAIDSTNGDAFLFQGLAYFNLGERQSALDSYRQACRRQDVLGCEMERSLAASR